MQRITFVESFSSFVNAYDSTVFVDKNNNKKIERRTQKRIKSKKKTQNEGVDERGKGDKQWFDIRCFHSLT